MSENWDVYFANVNDKLAALFIDLGLAEADDRWPTLLWVSVGVLSPDADGFPPESEAQALFDIEDSLLMQMAKMSPNAHFAGRMTTDGRRDFYLYAESDENFPSLVNTLSELFPRYQFEHGSQQDPDWQHYFDVLFPSPTDMQIIQNRRVIQALMENDDPLETPRTVTHYVYFATLKQRQAFIDAARALTFDVESLNSDTENSPDMPYLVVLARTDSVDFNSINETTLQLFNLAVEHGGEYDGWETEVLDNN